MKKVFQRYIIALSVIISCQACLDKVPTDSIPMDEAITTAEDINQLMIGVYSSFKNPSLYTGALSVLPDLQTDLTYSVKENSNTYGDIWRWNEIKPTNPEIEGVYAALYGVINRCNFLLDNAEKVRNNTADDNDLDRIDQYCGEAYFARALAYSELIKCFCVAYDSEEQASSVPGVVITRHYNGNEAIRRSSLKESYDFILEDLDNASRLLSLGDDFDPDVMGVLYNTEYFNEYCCYALRARIARLEASLTKRPVFDIPDDYDEPAPRRFESEKTDDEPEDDLDLSQFDEYQPEDDLLDRPVGALNPDAPENADELPQDSASLWKLILESAEASLPVGLIPILADPAKTLCCIDASSMKLFVEPGLFFNMIKSQDVILRLRSAALQVTGRSLAVTVEEAEAAPSAEKKPTRDINELKNFKETRFI